MTALRRTSSAVAALALTVALLIPVTAQAAPSLSIPVAGTTIGGGTFSGVFTLTSFAVKDGQVVALGTVSGILSNAGVVVGSALTTVAVPTQVLDSSSCDILHLDLGPLALDILGLKVDLSPPVDRALLCAHFRYESPSTFHVVAIPVTKACHEIRLFDFRAGDEQP